MDASSATSPARRIAAAMIIAMENAGSINTALFEGI